MSGYANLSRLDLTYREDTPRIRAREDLEPYYESRSEGTAVTLLNAFHMPKAGHVPLADDAESFQALVRKFIEEVDARA